LAIVDGVAARIDSLAPAECAAGPRCRRANRATDYRTHGTANQGACGHTRGGAGALTLRLAAGEGQCRRRDQKGFFHCEFPIALN
jgi:hypothetical protein